MGHKRSRALQQYQCWSERLNRHVGGQVDNRSCRWLMRSAMSVLTCCQRRLIGEIVQTNDWRDRPQPVSLLSRISSEKSDDIRTALVGVGVA